MGITVRQAVTGLVDEIAARFRRDPWRSVDTGVDHRHRHPGPGRELVGIGHAQIRVAPRRIVEPGPRQRGGRRAQNALFGRLIRARHVGRQRARIDPRWRDGRCGRRGEQRQRHRDQKDTVHSQNTPFVEIHCDSLSCVATLGHLTDLCAF